MLPVPPADDFRVAQAGFSTGVINHGACSFSFGVNSESRNSMAKKKAVKKKAAKKKTASQPAAKKKVAAPGNQQEKDRYKVFEDDLSLLS